MPDDMSHLELAESVEDVQRLLERCVEVARDENSADAYFPLIYSWETRDIAAAANAGLFDAPEELRRMIVAFANRYFEARAQFRANKPTPRSWALAFRAARSSSALVVQHLLLAMNAHVNLDLGAAAAATNLPWADFFRVDVILGRGVSRIQARLNRTTPVLHALDFLGGEFDEMFTIYSLKAARRQAFELAQQLRTAPEAGQAVVLVEADDRALHFGKRLLDPTLCDRVLLAALRLTEKNLSPRRLLTLLEQE
jgi:Family of unknown function (DUF5995)